MYLIFKTVTNSILDFMKNFISYSILYFMNNFISIGENSVTKWVVNPLYREKTTKNTI
jgi:hypothetical protein